jgi:hypothetical protein
VNLCGLGSVFLVCLVIKQLANQTLITGKLNRLVAVKVFIYGVYIKQNPLLKQGVLVFVNWIK